ncbi:MAG: protein kinase [Elusimicrobiota bacterium]|jgi:tetratricopeptide (TPR) repeat protein/tRNA A-37 threonylcarbamoyl transferase component Bud32
MNAVIGLILSIILPLGLCWAIPDDGNQGASPEVVAGEAPATAPGAQTETAVISGTAASPEGGVSEGAGEEVDESEVIQRAEQVVQAYMERAGKVLKKFIDGQATEEEERNLIQVQQDMELLLSDAPVVRDAFKRKLAELRPKPRPEAKPPGTTPPGTIPSGAVPAPPGSIAVGAQGVPGGIDRARQILYESRMNFSRGDIRRRPNDPKGYTDYGSDLVADQRYKEAVPVLERAVRLGSRDSRTYSSYGTAAFHLGDFALARSAASRALKLDPKNDAAFAVLKLSEGKNPAVSLPSALTGGSGGDGAFAIPSEKPAVSAGPAVLAGGVSPAPVPRTAVRSAETQKSAESAKEAASALTVKDYLRAVEAATRAIELNDGNAQAWNYRAIAHSKLGNYESAVRDSSYALGLVPNNTATLHTRSWALNKVGRFKEGLADADFVLARELDNAFALQNRAFALAGLGDRKGMVEALKRSADADPRFEKRYAQAVQVPENADVLFLFDQDPGLKPADAEPASSGGGHKVLFGSLAAAAFLVLLALAWTVAVPRLKAAAAAGASGAGPVVNARGESGSFWKKYRLVQEVGIGGMGVVYEAQDNSLGRRVAVKKMRDEIRLDRRERERFLQEARTVASLKHPNIVEIYSIVEDGGEVYLVFEFAEGKTLYAVLSEGKPLSFEAAKKVLADAVAAVDCAHQHKIVHRDIKPSNIMLAADGSAKVMDFGVARQAKEAATKVMTNTVVGTPPYMAPETEQGAVGPQADVYGLGVVFYEMLSGRLPFAGTGAGMLLNKMNRKFDPLSKAVPGLPAGVDDVVARVLAPDPAQRFKTAGEFLAAVSALRPS